jgi:hypothetical protein
MRNCFAVDDDVQNATIDSGFVLELDTASVIRRVLNLFICYRNPRTELMIHFNQPIMFSDSVISITCESLNQQNRQAQEIRLFH